MELQDESLPGFRYYEPDTNEYKHLRKSGNAAIYFFIVLAFLVAALLVVSYFFPALTEKLFSSL